MIYGYGIWKDIEKEFNKEFPKNTIRNFQQYNQIVKQYQLGVFPKDQPFVFLRFSKGDRALLDRLQEEGYNLFPNPGFSRFIRERETYLPKVDQLTKYPLKRVYVQNSNVNLIPIITEHFQDRPIVMKVGNLHASAEKYLIDSHRHLPYLKYKIRDLPITLEEFIPNARSIRVGFIGDPSNTDNYFITEHINSKTWLKNNNPEEELTYSYSNRQELCIPHIDTLINEVQMLAISFKADLLGVDYVISEERTGLLELNDYIGLPDGDFARDLFYRELKKIVGLDK